MVINNVYEDQARAKAYAALEFPGTYYLAYRDISEILAKHVNGKNALDFGCGAGRSTRFLMKEGFTVIGIDNSDDMVEQALELDPKGNYHVIKEADFHLFDSSSFDLITAIFTFDNIPTDDQKESYLKEFLRILKDDGVIVLLVSSPDIYKYEWASFTTKDFPQNKNAKTGDVVKIIMTDIEDRRPVEDVIYYEEDYRKMFEKSGLVVKEKYSPLGKESEPFCWRNETKIPPWHIYVLKAK